MAQWIPDLLGTFAGKFQLGKFGSFLKQLGSAGGAGGVAVRNAADSADAPLTAGFVYSASGIRFNYAATGSGGTPGGYKYDFVFPTTGMTADVTLTWPAAPGTAGQVIGFLDNVGTLGAVSAANTAPCLTVNDTTVAFGSTSPVAMFTLPANAVVEELTAYVDAAFNGVGASLSVGVSGSTSKYMGSGQVDLTTVGCYTVRPGLTANGAVESLIATFAAGTSASAGSCRLNVRYAVPA